MNLRSGDEMSAMLSNMPDGFFENINGKLTKIHK